jgi:hypothetical protein
MNAKLFVFALSFSGFRPLYLVNPHTRAIALTAELLKATLLRLLVRPPAQELGAVTKTAASEMIKLNLNYELRP